MERRGNGRGQHRRGKWEFRPTRRAASDFEVIIPGQMNRPLTIGTREDVGHVLHPLSGRRDNSAHQIVFDGGVVVQPFACERDRSPGVLVEFGLWSAAASVT